MPIRMEDDPQQPQRDPRRDNNQGGDEGGGGGLMQMIPFALMFIMKKPKLLIPVLLIAGVWFFFLGGQETLLGPSEGGGTTYVDNGDAPNNADFSFGMSFDQEKYDKTEVFEPLQYSSSGIPSRVSLKQYAPTPNHQGRQGSCVGWAASYAARTILHARATGQKPNDVAFSPSYLYNQIALTNCQGAYMKNAMETMKGGGVLPAKEFPYNDRSCSASPNGSQRARAAQFKTKGYNRLTNGASNYGIDINGMKQNIAQGAPVVIGMMVGGTFMHDMRGRKLWQPTRRDYSQAGYSGHAMCVIGYDDNMNGGAFQIQNSWGTDWGKDGIAWVTYQDFNKFTKEAYGLYPMGSAENKNFDPNKLEVKFGLVGNQTGQVIPLMEDGTGIFRTKNPIKKGDKFKVAITNSIECYVYVFGQETDGSSYVLFPYTPKNSAYCGIIGTRVFPREQSMVADQIGSRDRVGIVVSKKELNYAKLNELINSSSQPTYARKLQEVIASVAVNNVDFKADGAIEFSADLNGKNAVGMVIEIDKQ